MAGVPGVGLTSRLSNIPSIVNQWRVPARTHCLAVASNAESPRKPIDGPLRTCTNRGLGRQRVGVIAANTAAWLRCCPPQQGTPNDSRGRHVSIGTRSRDGGPATCQFGGWAGSFRGSAMWAWTSASSSWRSAMPRGRVRHRPRGWSGLRGLRRRSPPGPAAASARARRPTGSGWTALAARRSPYVILGDTNSPHRPRADSRSPQQPCARPAGYSQTVAAIRTCGSTGTPSSISTYATWPSSVATQ